MAAKKSGKIVIPLPLKDILPFSRAALRTVSLSLKCNNLMRMARGGAPGGRGRRGTLCARSMANNREKVEAPKVVVNQRSMKASGSLPSEPSGNPRKRKLLRLNRS